MRQSARMLTSFVAGALVALPGLAVAQGLVPIDTPSPADRPTVTAPPTRVPTVEVTEEDDSDADLAPVEVQEPDDVLPRDTDPDETDTGQGEVVSALAECLPGGRQLHGTGLTKGHLMRQAATDGEVTLGEGEEALPVSSVEEATALCDLVQDLADQTTAPDHAPGRPDWAGPKESRVDGEGRHGPPSHANDRAGR